MTSTLPRRSASPAARPFPWAGLIALSFAVFLSVTMEMLPTGLLPEISGDLGVSEAQAGLLVTVFAFTVVVASVPLAAVFRRVHRHYLLVGVLVALGVATLLTALAPDYSLAMGARVVGGLGHALFWATVGAYAGHLVPKEQIGRAVSIALGGGSAAFVLGVPLGTALGQAVGWRWAFALMAGLLLAGALVLRFVLPPVPPVPPVERAPSGERRPRDRTVVPVLVICAVVVAVMVGNYTFYTYIAPYLTEVMGLPAAAVAPVLFLTGLAGLAGLVLTGAVLGRRPTLGLLLSLVAVAVTMAALALSTGNLVVALVAFFVWGVAFGCLPPLLQTRLLHTASPAFRDMASAAFTSSFNFGIGGGALLGAVLYDSLGLINLPWVYAALAVLAALVLVITPRVGREQA